MTVDFSALATLPPWLAAAKDPERVAGALRSRVPELAGDGAILECRVKRPRLKERVWDVMYDVRYSTDGAEHTVRLHGIVVPPQASPAEPSSAAVEAGQPPFGTPEWHAWLPEIGVEAKAELADEGLPELPRLVDPEQSRLLLEDLLGTQAPRLAGIRIATCEPEVKRYKPGSRCTILYRLGYEPSDDGRGWPDVVIVKAYRGDKGQIAWDGMRKLWESPLATSGVAIAEPLAFEPGLRVLVQGAIPEERTLQQAIRDLLGTGGPTERKTLSDYIDATAAGLAALHSCGVTTGEVVTWDDELAEVTEVFDRMARAVPDLDGVAEPLLEELASRAELSEPAPPGPAHRSFRPAQVLLSRSGVGFIDFDGFCQAEPAIDIALFRATLKQMPMGSEGSSSASRLASYVDVADEFLDAYARHARIDRLRVALWEALDLLTVVEHCWTKLKGERLEDALWALRDHLASEPLGIRF